MSTFKIVSDSSSDIREFSAAFSSVPLKIRTDEREFCDDDTLNLSEMLTYLEKYKGKSGSAWANTSSIPKALACKNFTSGILTKSYEKLSFRKRVTHIASILNTGGHCIDAWLAISNEKFANCKIFSQIFAFF